jgi:hypothetical protein
MTQLETQKRSVVAFLRKFGTGGATRWQCLAGFTARGRAVRLEAISELLREQIIEQIAGRILRLKATL